MTDYVFIINSSIVVLTIFTSFFLFFEHKKYKETVYYIEEEIKTNNKIKDNAYVEENMEENVEEENIEKNVEKNVEEENEENFPDVAFERSFSDRIRHVEYILKSRLRQMEKIKSLEHIVSVLERIGDEEKLETNLEKRLNTVEQKIETIFNEYTFTINDFNNFCSLMYDDIKRMTYCKKHVNIMKKLGKLWKNMDNAEKMMYSSATNT